MVDALLDAGVNLAHFVGESPVVSAHGFSAFLVRDRVVGALFEALDLGHLHGLRFSVVVFAALRGLGVAFSEGS